MTQKELMEKFREKLRKAIEEQNKKNAQVVEEAPKKKRGRPAKKVEEK